MGDRHTLRAASFVIIQREGKILLGRRKNTSYYADHFGLPSGHLDGAETPVAAAIREAWEEVGVRIAPEHARFVHVMHRISPDIEYVDFYFVADVFEGEPRVMEPDKSAELIWTDATSLPKNVVPELRQALLLIQQNVAYSDYQAA